MTNRCEGLPSGPCPSSRCDNTVHNTIYDLFLCASCDKARAEAEAEVKRNADTKTKPPLKGKIARKASSRSNKPAAVTAAIPDECNEYTSSDIATITTKAGGSATNIAAATSDEDDSGDEVDENDACPGCMLSVCNEKRRVKCDICLQSYHQRCTPMTTKIYDKFIASVKVTGWSCEACRLRARTSFDRLQAAITQLAEELASVKCELKELRESKAESMKNQLNSDVNPVVNETVGDEARLTLVVHRTLNDSTRRKRNVIVSGMPETNNRDRDEFLRLCEDHLSLKPWVAENSCVRVGTSEPRKLLVRLASEEAATAVLRAAPSLRNSDEAYVAHSIFINPDLSRAAAQLAYEARKRRRDSRQQRVKHTGSAAADGSARQRSGRAPPEGNTATALTDRSVNGEQPAVAAAIASHCQLRGNNECDPQLLSYGCRYTKTAAATATSAAADDDTSPAIVHYATRDAVPLGPSDPACAALVQGGAAAITGATGGTSISLTTDDNVSFR